ncbi:TPA: hypothetical protein ACKP07_000264 [Serratia marcescens]|nr:hypothetical protein [Serratia marcescens]MBH2623747.1 hypothetical protein [Serratia marcescens]
MIRTLTAEHLNQIKADIAARKAMPEYGESVEGNIERLRVIGATRSHFSTETVEVLVRALEEKMRALADAERERDDWVEHSRRMEYRAIEAKELLANREAQPVGFRYRHKDTVSWLYNDWRWPDSVEANQCQIEWLYTAPPAPANANAVAWEMRYWNSGYNCWHDWERITEEKHAELSIAFATDSDHEFRVLYDAPPAPAVPDGWKLVPVEPTEEMLRAAYRESGVYSAKAYRAMLAAAPESVNGA